MVSIAFNIANGFEQDAFYGAFFKFVDTVSIGDADAISMRSEPAAKTLTQVLTFEDGDLADQFQHYWAQRRKWLGLLG